MNPFTLFLRLFGLLRVEHFVLYSTLPGIPPIEVTKHTNTKTNMAKYNSNIGGDHLAALIRPRLAALASKAVLTGYPKLSGRIAGHAANIGLLAKRGKADQLTAQDKTVLSFILAEAFRSAGVGIATDDTIVLTINPPMPTPRAQPTPQEQLTLTGGVTATVSAEPDDNTESDAGDTLGDATVDIPWERTPAKYEGLPVTITLTVPSEADWIKVFNS